MQAKVMPYSHDEYILLEDFEVEGVVVPKGYKTNGANLPLIARLVWDRYSPSFLSAVFVHDFMYDLSNDISADKYKIRKEADVLFKQLLKRYGRSSWTTNIFYISLRIANTFRKWFR